MESGATWFSRNTATYPGNGGDAIDVQQLIGSGPSAQFRFHLNADWGRHGLRLSVAPLSLSGTGQLASERRFGDAIFAPATPTKAQYRFDTYRLSYRYSAYTGDHWRLGVGLALLVRDAEIRLRQPGIDQRTTNVGLVPLLHLRLDHRLDDQWRWFLEVEGAAAEQGRAIDATAQLRYAPRGQRWEVGIGGRSLEGGADNSEVRTFAWYHSALAVLSWRW